MEHCVNLARTAGPTRRELLIGAASALLVPAAARAQAFPSKPLRVIAAGPAGATADLVARLVTEPLAKELGQVLRWKAGVAHQHQATSSQLGDGLKFLAHVHAQLDHVRDLADQ